MSIPIVSSGEKLRYYRESCSLSQQQVANALGIERSTYTKYETGASKPNLDTLVKISAVFNVPISALLPEVLFEDDQEQLLNETPLFDSPIYQLSKDERGLVAMFRTVSKDEKRQVIELMTNMSKKDK